MSKHSLETITRRLLLIHLLLLVSSVIPLLLFKSSQFAPYLRMISYYSIVASSLLIIVRPSSKLSDKVFGVTSIILIIIKTINKWY
ncbi:hypothetical protein U732_2727 [Clostridium argentinense CDC 2741]|uniref:Uncharacterized protein n=1 Tax=Clostridium argentinense CDC 2741 TaxID=1418104 RepID=A0A0C1TXE4_9CLOT|nr:hypothetical protein [Clostridium argentinense]ARC86722.1 hypothetical protein RSJ17_20620 [Clostridium argentinense]KIE45369.1 hypothetical protein U732_2727 [Clostridium argentinense CDC 2741]NFF38467.1 hypothetical protein [Clostridium argentinense]NFP49340.1 hypothetical protein [Clostridium argentinense]NFP71743.1 hypothetical protein [Clostridium argentinense]